MFQYGPITPLFSEACNRDSELAPYVVQDWSIKVKKPDESPGVFANNPPSLRLCADLTRLQVFLYFWDGRDGADFSGWWFGDQVGGTQAVK